MDRAGRLARTRLYLIATPDALGPGWLERVEEALRTGRVGMVQLRQKAGGRRAVRARARALRGLCDRHGALLVLNDRPELVRACGADGAHVGQADLPPERARALLGPDRLLGLSTHGRREVAEAAGRGADHAGLGPCFPSTTKRLERDPGGPALVRRALAAAGALPVFPIGGIDASNAPALVAAGACRLAVGAGVLARADPAAAVLALDAALAAATPPPAGL